MFKERTLVILGAGTSFEVDLPLGYELKDRISKLTEFTFEFGQLESGDKRFFEALLRCDHFNREDAVRRIGFACRKVSVGIGFVSSVDNFLEIHSADEDIQVCTKAAIAYLISESERASRLYVDSSNAHNRLSAGKLNDTWFQELSHILFEKVNGSDVSSAFQSVKFISFNYDRCLEWFLYQALTGLYGLDSSRANAILEDVTILHPYGDIGLPWWRGGRPDFFGFDIGDSVAEVSKRLITYTEGCSQDVIKQIRSIVGQANTILFLGFAFHPQNLDILRPQVGQPKRVANIFGTSLGMSENDALAVRRQLTMSFDATSDSVQLVDLKCVDFLRRYKRTLAV